MTSKSLVTSSEVGQINSQLSSSICLEYNKRLHDLTKDFSIVSQKTYVTIIKLQRKLLDAFRANSTIFKCATTDDVREKNYSYTSNIAIIYDDEVIKECRILFQMLSSTISNCSALESQIYSLPTAKEKKEQSILLGIAKNAALLSKKAAIIHKKLLQMTSNSSYQILQK